jgi:peroxiredoxin
MPAVPQPSTQPGPGSGWLLPSLELAHADGRRAPLWDYRGRGPLVVFLHTGHACAACATLLAALAARYRAYRAIGVQIVAVGQGPEPDLPYPALVDPAGRLAAALSLSVPALLVVGRTGEIWAAWSASHAALPAAAEIDQWLEYALSECRECFCCEQVWPGVWLRDPAP